MNKILQVKIESGERFQQHLSALNNAVTPAAIA